jgi:hypothetical protein
VIGSNREIRENHRRRPAVCRAIVLVQCSDGRAEGEAFAVEIELKRSAKSVIDRIVNLRDSL